MREDPAYRAALQRVEFERVERGRLLRIAEQPVLDDLRTVGLELDTVWDLYKHPDARRAAIPVLLRHLTLDYPDRVLEGIGQGLNDRSARSWWDDLKTLLQATNRDVVKDRLAAALAICATREHYEDLLGLLRNDSLGECRVYLLRPINRIGNRINPGQGKAVIESVAADPVLGTEATAIFAGRSRTR